MFAKGKKVSRIFNLHTNLLSFCCNIVRPMGSVYSFYYQNNLWANLFIIMFFKTADRSLVHRLDKLVPQLQQILCSKFVNFLTMNASSVNTSWSHTNKLLNEEHMESLSYLQCNFKNHIINFQGVKRIQKIVNFLQETDNDELLKHMWPSQQKLPQTRMKNFYLFDNQFKFEDLMKSTLMQQKAFNKIICFPKSQPIKFNNEYQRFCLNHNIKALSLTDFNLKSLMFQISKKSNEPTLIHEVVEKDPELYKDQSGKQTPTELIIFINKIKGSAGNSKSVPNMKQLMKYYMVRKSFSQQSKLSSPNLTTMRFQHIEEVKKYSQPIFEQQNITQEDQQDQQN